MTPITPYISQLLEGTLTTIELMIAALTVGFMLAIIFTLLGTSKRWYLKRPVDVFVFFMRGTPMLVQFFIIYYGSGQFDLIRDSFLWSVFKEPFACAVLALTLNTAAYTTALFIGAIKSVPGGEIEACKALGMSPFLRMRKIILPRALRIALPAYSNEVIMILKGTSLASTITVMELTGMTQQIIAQNYATMQFLLIAGVIYLALNAIIINIFKLLERRFAVLI